MDFKLEVVTREHCMIAGVEFEKGAVIGTFLPAKGSPPEVLDLGMQTQNLKVNLIPLRDQLFKKKGKKGHVAPEPDGE